MKSPAGIDIRFLPIFISGLIGGSAAFVIGAGIRANFGLSDHNFLKLDNIASGYGLSSAHNAAFPDIAIFDRIASPQNLKTHRTSITKQFY